MGVLTTPFLHGDYILGSYLIRRNINFAFVNQHMSVIDKLSRLATRSRKARPIDNIVQPSLEQEQKVFARDPLLARGLFEVISELSLENKVNSFDLLLLAKLQAITGERLSATHRIAVLSRRLSAALLNRTGRFVATVSLEEKFCTFAAAQTAHRVSIPSQSFLPPV